MATDPVVQRQVVVDVSIADAFSAFVDRFGDFKLSLIHI